MPYKIESIKHAVLIIMLIQAYFHPTEDLNKTPLQIQSQRRCDNKQDFSQLLTVYFFTTKNCDPSNCSSRQSKQDK